ncbi:MAG: HflK protein [Phycisphaerae bacterium]|nr:MAG: HflK protein [Phycisphaerae bacterium]
MALKKPQVVPPIGNRQFNIPTGPVLMGLIVLIFAFWLVRGGPAYMVDADEEGIVLRFGKYVRSTQPGFHFKAPWPIETVEKPQVTITRRIEFGFRTEGSGDSPTYISFMDDYSYLIKEAQMLTGDENIVNCSMAIQYKISDARAYLFNYEKPEAVQETLRDIGESALRQAVGNHPIDDVLTTGKDQVQIEVREKVQDMADLYEMGISITALNLQDVQPPEEVKKAFTDVASAREERAQYINEAKAYQSREVPLAEGQAEALKLEAQAYKEARIAQANGAVSRFQAIATQYRLAPELTRTQLYLDAMEQLLPLLKLTVIDENAGIVNLKSLSGGTTIPGEPARRAAPVVRTVPELQRDLPPDRTQPSLRRVEP